MPRLQRKQPGGSANSPQINTLAAVVVLATIGWQEAPARQRSASSVRFYDGPV